MAVAVFANLFPESDNELGASLLGGVSFDDQGGLEQGETTILQLDALSVATVSLNYVGPGNAPVFSIVDIDADPLSAAASLGVGDTIVLSNDSGLEGTSLSDFEIVSETFIACFARGTMIAVPDGQSAVETLQRGDLVMTADGEAVPVKWIGVQSVAKTFARDEAACPVRVRAGALGPDLPRADLVLTADHGLMVEGIMVNAGALVNGVSIVRVPREELADVERYYHVETDAHAVILANGMPAETFVDNTTRQAFDNFAEFQTLYGEPLESPAELPYPRAMSRRQVPEAVRQLVAERARLFADTARDAA